MCPSLPSAPVRVVPIDGRFVSVTTYRRDGRAVATPMWFVRRGRTLFVWTRADSGKVKRVRNRGEVLLAECDSKGGIVGPPVTGRAEILDACETAESLFDEKYGRVLEVWRKGQRLGRRLGVGHRWLYLRIECDPVGTAPSSGEPAAGPGPR